MLKAAEKVLATGGIEEFTVAAVADHAGMSVGTIYRRFENKEQLLHAVKAEMLDQLETAVTQALAEAEPSLKGVTTAFTEAVAHTFGEHNKIFPELLSGQRAEGVELGLRSLAKIQDALVEAAEPYREGVHEEALRFAARSITGSCVHRAATCQVWPDGLTWTAWADETAEMALAYLTSPRI
ncbi:TetR/AcrR family transcriptional regulator [Kibdelosporangium phytohabitans]|uniref:TetR/AcrR family transcriptional regulator n=1 Tax=Kibdelosporangium phytohabitans TaxID=860235 RepID=UPI0012FCBFC7|nr:TetR/AcrR family transcriptional regulator [Kibdelosporangium phytohabitans]MBE1470466.1 AcrR family transcriptional regulator [Kibdelosporangium phytohabitans]